MRRFIAFVDEISFPQVAAALVFVVLTFGVGYWALQFAGNGLAFTFDHGHTPSFLDSLYFSLVTISSLGFGDIRPVGFARVLVGAEVVIGLAFFGLLVSKLSSARQDYILRQLYAEKVEAEATRYAEALDEERELYRNTSMLLLEGGIDPEMTTTFRADVPQVTIFYRLGQLASSMSKMMAVEAHNNTMFGAVPDSTISRLYSGWQDVLSQTTHLWATDPDKSCDLVLCDNSSQIAEMLVPIRKMAELGLRDSKNPQIKSQCQQLAGLADQVERTVLPEVRRRETVGA